MDSVRLDSSVQYVGNTDNVLKRLLVQHSQALSKLRCEIKNALGIGPDAPEPTTSQLKKLSYLSNVIKESIITKRPSLPFRAQSTNNQLVLRLYPSVPVNSRAPPPSGQPPSLQEAVPKAPIPS